MAKKKAFILYQNAITALKVNKKKLKLIKNICIKWIILHCFAKKKKKNYYHMDKLSSEKLQVMPTIKYMKINFKHKIDHKSDLNSWYFHKDIRSALIIKHKKKKKREKS